MTNLLLNIPLNQEVSFPFEFPTELLTMYQTTNHLSSMAIILNPQSSLNQRIPPIFQASLLRQILLDFVQVQFWRSADGISTKFHSPSILHQPSLIFIRDPRSEERR